MLKDMFVKAKSTLKELSDQPVPLGKAVSLTVGLVLFTIVVYGKPKTIIVNNYNPGGCLF